MKIKKLVITGFGPYAVRQELDFEKSLQDKNMFVITGNTGAGKTTIFDAINFALYGEASGSDREGKSFRSDFADPQTPTEVELWFSLRGKEYYIKRTPLYLRPKKRGEGFAENKATAEIKLSQDKTITGVNEVTREIENILGITSEQFKQLVMIPQGEFKKLLNAESDKKEDIFRKIFGTEIFQSIQKQIKEQATKLERNIQLVERDRLNKMRSFECKDKNEELFRIINSDAPNIELTIKSFKEFVEEDKEEQKKVQAKIEEKRAEVEKISNDIALGEANNSKFDNLQKNKEELEKLNEQVKIYEDKKLQVDRGKKALTVKGYEDKYNEKKVKDDELKGELKNLENNIKAYKEGYVKAEQHFNEQKGKEEEKNQLNKNIEESERLKLKASEYETNMAVVKALDKKIKDIKSVIENIDRTIKENDVSIERTSKELEAIEKYKEEKGVLELKKLNCSNKKEKLNKLSKDIDSWIEKDKEHKKVTESFKKIEQNFNRTKERYELLEDTFRKNQAGILASDLQEGMPCPVCGSTEHPKLAKFESSEVTEELVKSSKEDLEKLREQRDEKLNELTNMNASLRTIKDNSIYPAAKELLNREFIEDINSLSGEVNELIKSNNSLLLELKNKIQGLNKEIDKEKEKIQTRDKLREKNDELRKELQSKNDEHVKEEGNLREAKASLDFIKNEFKGEIKTVSELDAAIAVLSDKLQALKRSYEAAEKAFSEIKAKLDQELGKYETKKQMKEKAEEELNDAVNIFKEKVLALGFVDYKDYKANCLTEEQMEDILKEISNFEKALAGAKKLYEASLDETKDLSKVDLGILKESQDKESNILQTFNYEKDKILIRLNNNVSVLEACEKYNKEIEKDEKEYEVVGRLSNIANGTNSKKISFERYVLAAYFEDIIEAANLRFNKMTSGRFELLRKQDIGDKRKGQGLDLEVYDNYTGKARDIKTLSGGESFKASLAMALGLADVVQAYAGGIQLDTMFIDEGFGTLDPESLDNAIECLMDLQNDGRLVGIISHVPELKERINARLEVSSSSNGSMAEFRV